MQGKKNRTEEEAEPQSMRRGSRRRGRRRGEGYLFGRGVIFAAVIIVLVAIILRLVGAL
jgi:hypothetical protein